MASAESLLGDLLRRADFWQCYAQARLDHRQRPMLNRMLTGFEGKLGSIKCAKLESNSHDTAFRDLQTLVKRVRAQSIRLIPTA